jgi:hypothetical protein
MSFFKSDPIGVKVQGRELKCLVYGHDAFWKREGPLNTAAASFFRFDWANASGNGYHLRQVRLHLRVLDAVNLEIHAPF